MQLGWANDTDVSLGLVDKVRFVIDEIEHSGLTDPLAIGARSADLTSAIRTRHGHSWRSMMLGPIVRAIGARDNLPARVSAALASIAVPARRRAVRATWHCYAASGANTMPWRR